MPPRRAMPSWIDPRLPLTWVIGSLTAVAMVVFGLYLTLKETEKRSLDNETAIREIRTEQKDLGKNIIALQLQLSELNGGIKNVDTKLDSLRILLNLQPATRDNKNGS